MKTPELIILAGSAGAFHVIYELVKKLPASYAIPVVVVMHRGKKQDNNLEGLWNNASEIIVKEITDKDEIKGGIVYLCPSDYHLFIEKEKVFSLDVSEPVLFSRPSIDLTIQSAAEVYKSKLLAILFSGANQDGALGLLKSKSLGGETIAQDPNEAEVDTMPLAAITLNAVNKTLKTKEIELLMLSFAK
ncbi:chemotaxis protein CheB [Pedobacter cryophilus]|uniref:protein-glutamate methylesterase n=1 Tax=Pedobacter cryophilus TaxID=2571271 RepID=A0A4V5NZ70_9SPHI|nr:chemotaxis protein CheB [Pedobacter cryophilus]TKB95514.1 chemotaxis protein CheB [Pedobacter cryophilus]